ncbi:MAG: class III extradiol ring-cleavage dioxygenase [Comamonas sp.]
MSSCLPVIYVSHGSPTFAIEPDRAGPLLRAVGERLPEVQAIAVISPHWMTAGGSLVTTTERPETIHDFGGFPQALYELSYPAPGAPQVAAQAAELLTQAGLRAGLHPRRGLDHGAWVPLMYLAPEARIPVFQISMPHPMTAEGAIQLGRALAPLREQGVLIVASGSLTHNLYEIRRFDNQAAAYVEEFTVWARQAVQAHDLEALAHYRERAPHALRAHPTDEHYWPLVIAMAASGGDDPVEVIDGGISHGVLSMEGYVLGELAAA